ncbi:hypothetical protein JD844_016750 [Phrynosoma platyrhinos]|uniref:Uncharacterized protein n=1 Tax=Phrynosoma platyrhinos TaxID=52577 RepID=A0ABQ7SKS9_PHRPL|nr:hypothetical protein JD844_016750 [Phrynosoma platyrhinos]
MNKPFIQMPSNSSEVPTNFVHTNQIVHSFTKRNLPVSSSKTQKTTSENSCRNDNGDFYKSSNETTASGTYPTTNNRSNVILSTIKKQMKRGNDNKEGTLPLEQKDTPESEKRNKALLKSLKNTNTNLKPDPIEHNEDVSSSLENNTFSYPDFLPSPYNTLDLQKLSKLHNWRSGLAKPLDQPFDQLVSRLVRMEKLQRLTILQEKTKETVAPAVAVNNSFDYSKNAHQLKEPRSSDFSSSQKAFHGDLHNLGGCVHEPHLPKCTSQRYHNNQTSGGLSPAHSTTKHPRASGNTSKYRKAPVTADSTNAELGEQGKKNAEVPLMDKMERVMGRMEIEEGDEFTDEINDKKEVSKGPEQQEEEEKDAARRLHLIPHLFSDMDIFIDLEWGNMFRLGLDPLLQTSTDQMTPLCPQHHSRE